jgi:archaellum biogenesis protein FlaJ (TadC family)
MRMALNSYQSFCYRILGKRFKHNPEYDRLLEMANIGMIGEVRKSVMWMTFMLLFFIPLIIIAVIVLYAVYGAGYVIELPTIASFAPQNILQTVTNPIAFIILVCALISVIIAPINLLLFITQPGSTIKTRQRRIDEALPSSLSFISAMAATTVTPHEIFNSLSKQKAFGEVAEEARRIYTDMTLFGRDAISAINDAIERSVSTRWREFLQGMISTINSGGELRAYFTAKAEEAMSESRENLRRTISSISVMAEAYVTVGISFPIFLIILLVAMGGTSTTMPTETIVSIVVFLLIPIIQAAFGYLLYTMSREAGV